MKYIVLLILLSMSVFAAEVPELDGTPVQASSVSLDDLSTVKETLNTIAMPGFVVGLFGNERINLQVTRHDFSEALIGIVTEDGKVLEIDDRTLENPTLIVTTTEQTMEDIFEASDPFNALSEALSSGDLSYKAVTFGNKLKLGFGRVIITVVGWFR
jgi:alpha-galactosidase|tara:strand:+ start:1280 stop:1750 length:471 start_codon:yes stop_codon:yes gene_type:complete